MGALSIKQWLILTGALFLCVLLFLAPTDPPLEDSKTKSHSELDMKVQKAVEMVQEGGQPMKGIGLLMEVLEEDPNHMEALFTLGVFSIQSGQYEKAIERFERVLNIDADATDAYFYLGHSHAGAGNNEKAIDYFEKYIAKSTDPKSVEEAKKYINKLKNI